MSQKKKKKKKRGPRSRPVGDISERPFGNPRKKQPGTSSRESGVLCYAHVFHLSVFLSSEGPIQAKVKGTFPKRGAIAPFRRAFAVKVERAAGGLTCDSCRNNYFSNQSSPIRNLEIRFSFHMTKGLSILLCNILTSSQSQQSLAHDTPLSWPYPRGKCHAATEPWDALFFILHGSDVSVVFPLSAQWG